MKKLLHILFIFQFAFFNLQFAISQNLVFNNSFEDTVSCPTGQNQVENAVGWKNLRGTPDYFNSCATHLSHVSIPSNSNGYQCPANGNAYCGILVYGPWGLSSYKREFLGTELTNPLIIGQRYYVSFKVNLANESLCACNKLGALFSTFEWLVDTFSTAPLENFAHIYTNQIITDTSVWTTISGSFVADSNYKYIIMGNHWDDNNTDTLKFVQTTGCNPFYFFDDVCVSLDSLTCEIPNGPNVCDSTINVLETNRTKEKITIYPNPTSNKILIDLSHSQKTTIKIYNLFGLLLCDNTFSEKNITIDLSSLPDGIYLIQAQQDNKFFNKIITLIK
jgi:hypothetical protein